MKKTFLFLCFAVNLLFGQGIHNHWYFGNQAAMNFTTGSPTVLTNSAMTCIDMSGSISTKSGKLLFYTNGNQVWDSTHQIMPNGTGLLGGYTGGQIATIVPHPRNTDGRGWHQYFIFTNTQFGDIDGFRYSIVDMNLNSGNGDVLVKNKLVLTPNSEKCAVVPHKNGVDYWVIIHELTTDAFRAYPLTYYGIDTSAAVISHVGAVYGINSSGYQAIGQLTASKQGNKLASAHYDKNFLQIYDFNNVTGIVSNPQSISGYDNSFGCEFSEDGTKLYFTQWNLNKNIYQVDLLNSLAVSMIGTATSAHPAYGVGYLQLAPDGKIYFSKFNSPALGCIPNPNLAGAACGFVDNAVNLLGATSSAGLPNNFKYPSNTNAIEQPLVNHFEIEWQNPVQGNLHFFAKAAIEPNMEVNMYEISGKLLENISLYDFIGKNSGSLNLANFTSGVYFCVLKKNGKIVSNQKVIIY